MTHGRGADHPELHRDDVHPDGPIPSSWPPVKPNSEGLQRFVYAGTRDFMRKVSDHVSIGTAYKGDKALDHYFTLCRED